MTIIKTKYFILRPIKMSDAVPYFKSQQNKETKLGFMTVPKNLNEAKKEIKESLKKSRKGVSATFVMDVNGEYAGSITVDYENYNPKEHRGRIHYSTDPKFRGQGLTTKAVRLVTDYGFKHFGLVRIMGTVRSYNKASARVLKKAGYGLEGILHKNRKKDGKYVDDMIWAKVK